MAVCPHCGAQMLEGAAFCVSCGQQAQPPAPPAYEPTPAYAPQPQPQYEQPPVYTPQPQYPPQPPVQQVVVTRSEEDMIPEKYRPISPWAYWGLSILYTIPIIGFVFMIVFSFSSGNINRRNFTRSYFCWLFLLLIVITIILIAGGGSAACIYGLF